MARYNAQKRATLDRLTLMFQLRIRELYRRDLSAKSAQAIAALKNGRAFNPTAGEGLEKALHKHLSAHQRKVIEVGISDGIQEVSPENKLGRWMDFPDSAHIEHTLSVELAGKRDEMADDFMKERRTPLAERLRKYVDSMKEHYLKVIREDYARAARRWLSGEEDEDMVRAYLKRSLQRADNQVEMVLRTETTNYFNESRQTYFERETAVDFIQLYAVTDGRISDICECRHQYVVPIEKAKSRENMPAFHPHCRTVQRPLFSSIPSHKALIDKGNAGSVRAYCAKTGKPYVALPDGWGGGSA